MAALSRLPVGSSASTTSGSLLNARAIATRWRWPPDKAEGRNDARSARPTCSSRSAARRRAARGERPASNSGSSTFSTAVHSSIRWNAWKTKPTAVRRIRASAFSPNPSMRRPASESAPPEGRSSPPNRCSSVDFPQPLGPITATVSPEATSRSTPSTARTSPSPWPYSLRSPQARSTKGVVAHDALLRSVQLLLACLQPAQVGLEAEHDALQQQRGVRVVRLGHRRALGVAQTAQQLTPLRVHDRERVRQPGRRRRDQLEMELRQVGLGPAHLRQPLGDSLLTGRGQRIDLAVRRLDRPAPTSPGPPFPDGSARRRSGRRSSPPRAGRAPARSRPRSS